MTHEARTTPPEAVGGPHAPANQEDGARPLLERVAREAMPSTQTSHPLLSTEAVQEEDTQSVARNAYGKEDAEQVVGEGCEKEDVERRGWARSVMASFSSIIPPGG
ncbi:amino acid transporter, partial [Trypanosoma rangeli]